MGRIIKPHEIQAQANSVMKSLEKDEEMLRDTLVEIESFSQTDELQGDAWNGMKSQMNAHKTVIQGLVCMTNQMADASTQLISACGDEDLDEALLLDQIEQLENTRTSHEDTIESYESWLRNDIYEVCLGWYARERIRDYQDLIKGVDEQIQTAEEKLTAIDDIDNATRDLTMGVENLCNAASQGIKYLESTWNGSGYSTTVQNLAWMSILNEAWEKALSKEEIDLDNMTKEEFVKLISDQFGFDERSAGIMFDIYEKIQEVYKDLPQEERNWYFARALSQLGDYNSKEANVLFFTVETHAWRNGAGWVRMNMMDKKIFSLKQ